MSFLIDSLIGLSLQHWCNISNARLEDVKQYMRRLFQLDFKQCRVSKHHGYYILSFSGYTTFYLVMIRYEYKYYMKQINFHPSFGHKGQQKFKLENKKKKNQEDKNIVMYY